MTKKPAPHVTILSQLDTLKTEARAAVAALDAQIRDKHAQLDRLLKSVRQTDAAALIAADLRRQVGEWRAKLANRAATAANLRTHAEITMQTGVNGDGSPMYATSTPSRLDILEYDAPGIAALALLWDEERIEAWAQEQAAAAGCPAMGKPIAELKEAADALHAEFVQLNDQRAQARAALSNLIDMELSPLIDGEQIARMHAPQPDGQRDQVEQVGVFDAQGNPLSAAGSDGYGRFWEDRRRAEALERAALSDADTMLADADDADTRALRNFGVL